MGHQCCSKQKVKRGLWSPEEDDKLVKYITTHGHGCWSAVPKLAGLQRCGKSCRLRWINYLRPDLKRGSFTEEEERIIIDVHRILGNRWAQIAKHLPGRTDNEVKNFWNSCIKKKLVAQGLDPKTHNLMRSSKSGSFNNNLANSTSSQYPSGTTPFTISSPGKNNADPMKSGALLDINPALLALPPRTLHINEPNVPVSGNYPYQENGVLMSFKDHQNPNPNPNSSFDFANAASCSSSSLDHATNIPNSSSPFNHANGFLDDQSVMWAPNGIDTMDISGQPNEAVAATIHAVNHHHEVQQITHHDQAQNYHVNEKGMEIDATYAGNAFDIELMDSALMPCGMLYGGGGNSMEQLQWDC